jgi:hypothetical protein
MLFYQAVLASFIAAICAGSVTWFIHRRFTSLANVMARGRVGRDIPRNLQRYLIHLSRRTLQIQHPWMHEKQILGDILVPISLMIDNHRIDLRSFLADQFSATAAPRVVMTGSPGSGKSIALGDIARFLPIIKRPGPRVPVLMTFSDLKGKNTKEDIEAVIGDKLRLDQFTAGKPDREGPNQYVNDHLYTGDVVLLIDGYDELDREQRSSTSRFVCDFLGTYPRIPAVLVSRTAVYEREGAFRSVATEVAEMAPFSPLAINRFVSQWKFDEGKSGPELLAHINGKAHLSELASNPLMLTIICFLYAQPKYLLPDNRVDFYRECCRALLEKWDLVAQVARANRFETDHKIDILSRIAYRHVSKSATTDEEISATEIGDITEDALRALSLNSSDAGRVVREIVDNSGLLVELPPDAYRFPHRTFLEFFAAVYLYEQETVERLLSTYAADEPRWRPTLLMYAGLCRNREACSALLKHLTGRFTSSLRQEVEPDVTVFSALIETSFATPEIADQLLTLAEDYLSNADHGDHLIDELGYLGANTKWTYSAKALTILTTLLQKPLPSSKLQAVLLAAMRCRDDPNLRTLIASRLGDLDLVEVFIKAGHQASYYLNRLLEIGIATDRKQQLIDGLLEGGHLGLLADIMVESGGSDLADIAGLALYQASATPSFFEFLDGHEVKSLKNEVSKYVDDFLSNEGWPFSNPKTETGRALAVAIAFHAAHSYTDPLGAPQTKTGATWLGFLIRLCMPYLHGPTTAVQPIADDVEIYIPPTVLRHVWRNVAWQGAWWSRAWRYSIMSEGIDISSISLIALTSIILYGVCFIKILHVARVPYVSDYDVLTPGELIVLLLIAAAAFVLFWRQIDEDVWLKILIFIPNALFFTVLESPGIIWFKNRKVNLNLKEFGSIGPKNMKWYPVIYYRTMSVILGTVSVILWVTIALRIFSIDLLMVAILLAINAESDLLVKKPLFGGPENYRIGQKLVSSAALEISLSN